jgi:hypothetical protein
MPVAKKQTALTASLPAPIGGWNARDSLAEMQPLDAVVMNNFFPTPTDVTLRKGYSLTASGISGRVLSLMNYTKAVGYDLFAFANDKIYETKGTLTQVFSGLTTAKWQHINLTNSGGHFLIAASGVDPVLVYDGSKWAKQATTTTAQTISTITRGGTGNLTATLTTASAHGLITGNRVTIAGATESNYNGTYVITVTSPTVFTYTMATAPSADATVVGTYTVFGLTGVNSSTLANVNLFKNRLYYCQKDTLDFWYGGVDEVSGALTRFPLGGVARNGGYLQAMGTWTLDAGYGVDDLAVFVTSMGEVIVYKGSNPSDPTDWALVGVWQMGQTFTRRCFFKWGGDLLLLTQGGLLPLTAALQSSRLDPRVNLTDKIFYAVSQATTQYFALDGWQINFFASENMLILSIPTASGMEQYVMHTITKSWARFTGIEAYCWEVSGDADIHFGGQGIVGDFYQVTSDNGTNIVATCQQAYNYFETRGMQKRFTLVRPILQTDNGVPTVLCGISTDFDTTPLTNQIAFNPSITNTGIWDASLWDQANWGGGLVTTKIWQGVTGLGYAGSININVASQGIELHWASTDYVMEKGSVI